MLIAASGFDQEPGRGLRQAFLFRCRPASSIAGRDRCRAQFPNWPSPMRDGQAGEFYTGLAMGLTAMLGGAAFLFRRRSPSRPHQAANSGSRLSKAARLSFPVEPTPDDDLLTRRRMAT